MRLLVPVMLLRLWWRGRAEPLYRRAVGERLGHPGAAPVPGRLWVHAVSLGETRAAAALLDALRALRPGLPILLTHGTATGREAGKALLRDGDAQAWLPWDSPGAVRRFLAAHRPAAGVLMETEVWPMLLHAAADARVPVLLANARLSERSLHRGLRFESLLRPAVQSLAQVLAQTEDDAVRLRRIGAVDVRVCGNLKFDMTPAPDQLTRGRAWRSALGRPVVLAASTREGEEEALLAAWRARAAVDDGMPPLLLIVPRHPQRFDEVAALCLAAGLAPRRRSAWAGEPPAPEDLRAAVWLGDSLGELPLYYAAADVALLGGSFAPHGGQNLIEAAACGCPLVIGPSTFNFAEAATLALAAGAAVRVDDLRAAVETARSLVAQPARREDLALGARDFAAHPGGAAARIAAHIDETLGAR
ncbi:MAG: 3-deoxy-D-manno-octulosonic acid transferase [Ideonella sp.]|nr:3-deoxy-D-manno-octulosonic acid transferase [Ideonella sp.]